MAYQLATRSSTEELEVKIRAVAKETGLSLSEIYRQAHFLFLGNHERKKKVGG